LNILFLSRWYPYPQNNGSKIRIYNLLTGLSHEHDVSLISFYERSDPEPDLTHMQKICQDVQVIQHKGFAPNSLRSLLGFFSLKPRSFIDVYSNDMRDKIEKSIEKNSFDCIIASQIDMAAYAEWFDCIPAIFEEAELGILYDRFAEANSLPAKLRHWLTWRKSRSFITKLLKEYKLTTVVSERERQLLSRIAPQGASIEIIPNCINLKDYEEVHAAPQAETLIFIGSFNYQPNYQGMVWFLEKVYPLLKASHPNLKLTITGAHGGRPLPNSRDVTLTGYVEDIRPIVARAWCSIVPLHIGGGTRIKILDAMALRTPVVSTSKGAEGLEVNDGEHILIADDPRDFAEAVRRILESYDLRQKLADNAYNLVCEKYDWEIIMPRFLQLLEKAVDIHPSSLSGTVETSKLIGVKH